MPGSFNVPFTEIVENGRLVSPERIKTAFAKGGVDLDKSTLSLGKAFDVRTVTANSLSGTEMNTGQKKADAA